jgi:hypothetical protein
MEHILLKTAFNYKKRKEIEPPKNFKYNNIIGAWLSKTDDSLLVNHKDFPQIGTKKHDIETGEDQKGQ